MSRLRLVEQAAAPDTPGTGMGVLYLDSNGNLCVKRDDGTVQGLSGPGVLTIPASGTPALLGTANVFTAKQVMPGVVSGTPVTVNDDAAFSITAPANYGIMFLMAGNLSTVAGAVFFRCQNGSAGQCALIASGAGTLLATTTDTVLSGTTGLDTKVTISSNPADSKIYIENRSGSARVIAWFFIAA